MAPPPCVAGPGGSSGHWLCCAASPCSVRQVQVCASIPCRELAAVRHWPRGCLAARPGGSLLSWLPWGFHEPSRARGISHCPCFHDYCLCRRIVPHQGTRNALFSQGPNALVAQNPLESLSNQAVSETTPERNKPFSPVTEVRPKRLTQGCCTPLGGLQQAPARGAKDPFSVCFI